MKKMHLIIGPAGAALYQLTVQLLHEFSRDCVGIACVPGGGARTPKALLEETAIAALHAGHLLTQDTERRLFLVQKSDSANSVQCLSVVDARQGVCCEGTQMPVDVWYLFQEGDVEDQHAGLRAKPQVKREISQWLDRFKVAKAKLITYAGADPAKQEAVEDELEQYAIPYQLLDSDRKFSWRTTTSLDSSINQKTLQRVDCHGLAGPSTGQDGLLFARERGLLPCFNIAEHLLRLAQDADPNAWALRHETGSIRYGELEGYVHACVTELVDLGVGPGCRVTVVSSDSINLSVTLIALLYMGATAVIINPLMQGPHMLRALECANSMLTVADESSIQALAGAEAQDKELKFKPTLVDSIVDVRCWHENGKPKKRWLAAPTSPFDFAFGMFTSGTTGTPKLVLHRHQDFLVASERYASQVLNVGSSDRLFSASRVSFAFGLHNMFNALLHKATAILAPCEINAQSVIKYIRKYKPTAMFAVPTIYQFILALDVVDKSYFKSIDVYVSAGERLPQALGEKWQSFVGLAILDSLGSTEVFSTYLGNLPGCARPDATGKLVPGFNAKLVGADGNICAVGEAGTLWIKGPTVIDSYHSGTPANGTQFADGWFCTNDVFRMDSEEYFYYCGRSDDMFKVAGQWISPQEIENVLLRHPDVLDVAVIPVGGCEKTTRPKAYVVLRKRDKQQSSPVALKEWSKTQLEHWKYPHFVEYVDQLPRTATGKLQRYLLREQRQTAGTGR